MCAKTLKNLSVGICDANGFKGFAELYSPSPKFKILLYIYT